jgi:TRAP-type C4-dicarboxylate transport system permease small subunit
MENQIKGSSPAVSPEEPGSLMSFIDRATKPIIMVATIIGGTAVAAMMFLTFFSVGGRVVLAMPIKGYYEIIESLMLLMTVFAIVYTASQKKHIRVDILANYLPRKANLVLDVFTFAVAFGFMVLVTWRGWMNGLDNMHDKLTSGVLHYPIYPFNFILAIATAILSLIFLFTCIKAIAEVKK